MRNASYTRNNGSDVAFLTQHLTPPLRQAKNWVDILSIPQKRTKVNSWSDVLRALLLIYFHTASLPHLILPTSPQRSEAMVGERSSAHHETDAPLRVAPCPCALILYNRLEFD